MGATEVTDRHELHGVQAVLFVPDVRRTLDYYRDTLGFHIDFEAGEPLLHARVSSGDREHASAARIRFETAPSTAAVVPSFPSDLRS
jgi:catechol 2,3-dioxygenase-like lactoylglutathione lyase family enzyme